MFAFTNRNSTEHPKILVGIRLNCHERPHQSAFCLQATNEHVMTTSMQHRFILFKTYVLLQSISVVGVLGEGESG